MTDSFHILPLSQSFGLYLTAAVVDDNRISVHAMQAFQISRFHHIHAVTYIMRCQRQSLTVQKQQLLQQLFQLRHLFGASAHGNLIAARYDCTVKSTTDYTQKFIVTSADTNHFLLVNSFEYTLHFFFFTSQAISSYLF